MGITPYELLDSQIYMLGDSRCQVYGVILIVVFKG